MYNGGTTSAVIDLIQHYLNIDWKKLVEQTMQKKDFSTRTNAIIVPRLEMTVDDTEYKINGSLATSPIMPEGILK